MTANISEKKISRSEELTCNELNTAKIYRNGRECVLTASTPKIQEMPSIGRSTATAFAVSLKQSKRETQFILLVLDMRTVSNNQNSTGLIMKANQLT